MSKANPEFPGSRADKFIRFMKGEYDPVAGKLEMKAADKEIFNDPKIKERTILFNRKKGIENRMYEAGIKKNIGRYERFKNVFSVVAAVFMIVLLLWTVYYLPAFGDPNAPENNEVTVRYIEQGLYETGAVNIVAGMILDYRAFDTFGESCVLFVASCCVWTRMRIPIRRIWRTSTTGIMSRRTT